MVVLTFFCVSLTTGTRRGGEGMIAANIALDIVAIVLSMVPIFYLLGGYRYHLRLNQYFLGVCVSNLLMIVGDLPDWIIRDPSSQAQKIILSASSALFYVASGFVLYYFGRYIIEYLNIAGRVKKACLSIIVALCAIQIFFAIISPFTGSFFYVANSGYQRGNLFWLSQIIPALCYTMFTCLIIAYHRRLAWREVIFFLLYIFVPLGGGVSQMLLRGISVVNIGVALALLFILVNIQFEHEMLVKRQEQELAELHTDIMLSQIQPHFLYNTLTTIRQLCELDPQLAKECISDFSYFLRGNMDSLQSKAPIPFERELNHSQYYLRLEQQRFVGRLSVELDTPVMDFSLPPLTLQPLVENAVRHGIIMRENGGTITIKTEETKSAYIVTVSDDGVGFLPNSIPADSRSHIGIQNVRKRLKDISGGTLIITSALNVGTSAVITIPKEGKL